MCFIYYTEAFKKIRQDEIITQLTQLKINGKDLPPIENLYWEQTAAMRVEIGSFEKTKLCVTQGCVLSPELLSLYSKIIMQNLEGCPGSKVGKHNVHHLRYTSNSVIIRHLRRRKQKERVSNT